MCGVFDCTRVGASNPHVVQRSSVLGSKTANDSTICSMLAGEIILVVILSLCLISQLVK